MLKQSWVNFEPARVSVLWTMLLLHVRHSYSLDLWVSPPLALLAFKLRVYILNVVALALGAIKGHAQCLTCFLNHIPLCYLRFCPTGLFFRLNIRSQAWLFEHLIQVGLGRLDNEICWPRVESSCNFDSSCYLWVWAFWSLCRWKALW